MSNQTEDDGPKPYAPDVDTSTHPLIQAVLGDDDPPSGLVALVGYFGPSRRPNHVRLYLTLDFLSYLELPTNANQIVSTAPTVAGDPNCPTRVLVKAGMKLEIVRVSSTEASFLQGGIAGSNPRAADGMGLMGLSALPGEVYVGSTRRSVHPCVCSVCW